MLAKLKRIAKRHRMPLGKALFYEGLVRAWTKPSLRALLRLPFRARQPQGWIFVVGCYNAGTTIVKDVILSHPQVAGMPVEGDSLTSALDDFESGAYPRAMFANAERIQEARKQSPPDPKRLCADWAPWIRADKQFLEKSISASMRIPHLRAAFPGCRFVCVVRHPEDVAKGIRKRSRPASGGEYEIEFLNQQWAFFYRTILEDSKPEDTIFCSYENFIRKPLAETARLHEALDLEPLKLRHEDGVLHIGKVERSIRPLPRERDVAADGKQQIIETLAALQEQNAAPASGEQS